MSNWPLILTQRIESVYTQKQLPNSIDKFSSAIRKAAQMDA